MCFGEGGEGVICNMGVIFTSSHAWEQTVCSLFVCSLILKFGSKQRASKEQNDDLKGFAHLKLEGEIQEKGGQVTSVSS